MRKEKEKQFPYSLVPRHITEKKLPLLSSFLKSTDGRATFRALGSCLLCCLLQAKTLEVDSKDCIQKALCQSYLNQLFWYSWKQLFQLWAGIKTQDICKYTWAKLETTNVWCYHPSLFHAPSQWQQLTAAEARDALVNRTISSIVWATSTAKQTYWRYVVVPLPKKNKLESTE